MPGCFVRTLLFSSPCDDMLNMLVCNTHWLSMHLYTLAYMSMHESCLLVCRPYSNTMKLWTFNPNTHLSLVDTTFCLLYCLFAFLFICFLVCLLIFACHVPATCYACHIYLAYLLCTLWALSTHLFLSLLVYWFLVLASAWTHMEWGRIELGHGLLGASKKGEDANMWI